MRTRNFKTNNIENLPSVYKSLCSDGFRPTVALVFANISYDFDTIQKFFSETGVTFIGSSAAGEFIDGEFEEPAIVALLMEVDPSCFALFFKETNGDYVNAGKELGAFSRNAFNVPVIVAVTSGIPDGELLVNEIEEGAGTNVPVYGGLASDDFKMQETFVFSNNGVSGKAIAALVIDSSRIEIEGMIYGGWYPAGITRTITKSEQNTVYTIDNEPALDLIARYCHKAPEEFVEGPEAVKNLTTHFQILLYRDNSYPVLRTAVMASLEDRSLTFLSKVPQGSKMQFSLTPSFEVIDNVIDKYTELKQKYEDPEALVLFSCKGRQMIFGPWIADEVGRIHQIWEAPLTGFLSYGEIGKARQQETEFHNMACSLLLLKEK